MLRKVGACRIVRMTATRPLKVEVESALVNLMMYDLMIIPCQCEMEDEWFNSLLGLVG